MPDREAQANRGSTRRRWAWPALLWLGTIAFIACEAPLLANGVSFHPTGEIFVGEIFESLTVFDVYLAVLPILLLAWQLARRGRTFACAIILVGIVCAATTTFAPARFPPPLPGMSTRGPFTLVPWSPHERLNDRNCANLPPGSTSSDPLRSWNIKAAPNAKDGLPYYLGTDSLGQDVLSNLIWGCRTALGVGLVATVVALSIGILVGALAGWLGGWPDALLLGAIQVFKGVPVLVLLVAAAGVLPRSSLVMTGVIACFTWTTPARLVRAEVMRVKSLDFVLAARAAGLPTRAILLRHVLPSALSPVRVEAGFIFAAAILAEATLSFLGLAPEDQASWGRLIASAVGESGGFHWWLAVFPGTAICLTLLAVNSLSERRSAS